MIKCGLYARVSTDLQAEVKNGSLDTQIDRLQEVCRTQEYPHRQRKNGKPLQSIVKKENRVRIWIVQNTSE